MTLSHGTGSNEQLAMRAMSLGVPAENVAHLWEGPGQLTGFHNEYEHRAENAAKRACRR